MSSPTRRRRPTGPATSPATGVFLGALVITLVALLLPGWWGTVPLALIVIGMAWLMTKTWPVTPPQTRALRILVLLILLGIAMYKVTRR